MQRFYGVYRDHEDGWHSVDILNAPGMGGMGTGHTVDDAIDRGVLFLQRRAIQ